ncbi:PREDICTED: uncharacterized protein LOC105570977 [Vollenhovia emeryi]|uniref:uncharacterized protein LOC105570977 n=1 Tax=Vollenhovia emeryi TaxID=411798 RepID=UPI0005F48C73|nr:PREDICTED: uncharacterized protein LOC105570977 [Vollenhovia emeryi]
MPQDGGVQITAESLVHKVAVRVPPFWNDEPELWFAQLEGQFTISGITQDSTKYSYALSQLNSNQIKEIKDLLELEELGDRKPSQFLRHLRTLAGNNVPDSLLRTLWLGRLPQQAQMILATRTDDCLNDVAVQADRIHEMTNKAVASTSTPAATSLEAKVEALTKQVASLTTHLSRDKKRDKKSERKRSRSRSQKPAKSTDNEKHCYYHNRFGEKAKKCTQPCTYKSENEKESH